MSSNQPTKRTFFIPNPIVSRIEPVQRLEALNEYAKLINDVLAIEGFQYNGVKQNAETLTTTIDVNPVVSTQSTT